MAPQTVI